MSEQQMLPLPLPSKQDYGSWVQHVQVENAASRLALWLVRGGLLWLSSDEIAGKSHLINAVFREYPQVKFLKVDEKPLSSVQQLKDWLGSCEHHVYWVLDLPAGKLSPALGYAVFHLIERAKNMNKSLLISWRCKVDDLQPPELSSRLLMFDGVYMSAPQHDEDLQKVLQSVLRNMQWDMKDTVLPVLLQYVPRELSALLDAIDQLDDYSKKHNKKMNGARALKILGHSID
ncbi:MAG: glucose-inhibited division protein A [Ghiorsea sp.]|nr:glucose-inhibited division protein A [Ghiorsea sp.]